MQSRLRMLAAAPIHLLLLVLGVRACVHAWSHTRVFLHVFWCPADLWPYTCSKEPLKRQKMKPRKPVCARFHFFPVLFLLHCSVFPLPACLLTCNLRVMLAEMAQNGQVVRIAKSKSTILPEEPGYGTESVRDEIYRIVDILDPIDRVKLRYASSLLSHAFPRCAACKLSLRSQKFQHGGTFASTHTLCSGRRWNPCILDALRKRTMKMKRTMRTMTPARGTERTIVKRPKMTKN